MEQARTRAKRPQEKILLGILDFLSTEDKSKTDIVYKLNLNFNLADRYLGKLNEKKNISWNAQTRLWHLTPAGESARQVLRDSLQAIEAVL